MSEIFLQISRSTPPDSPSQSGICHIVMFLLLFVASRSFCQRRYMTITQLELCIVKNGPAAFDPMAHLAFIFEWHKFVSLYLVQMSAEREAEDEKGSCAGDELGWIKTVSQQARRGLIPSFRLLDCLRHDQTEEAVFRVTSATPHP